MGLVLGVLCTWRVERAFKKKNLVVCVISSSRTLKLGTGNNTHIAHRLHIRVAVKCFLYPPLSLFYMGHWAVAVAVAVAFYWLYMMYRRSLVSLVPPCLEFPLVIVVCSTTYRVLSSVRYTQSYLAPGTRRAVYLNSSTHALLVLAFTFTH